MKVNKNKLCKIIYLVYNNVKSCNFRYLKIMIFEMVYWFNEFLWYYNSMLLLLLFLLLILYNCFLIWMMCVIYCRYRRGEIVGFVCGGGNFRGVFCCGRGGVDYVLDL